MPAESLGHDTLKSRHRAVRDAHPDGLTLRIHRALSWLKRAEQAEDMDGRFIFLWIAFNAAYAQEFDDAGRTSDKASFSAFLDKLCALDRRKALHGLIWNEFSASIRTLLENPYVFHPFWEYQRGRLDQADWEERFDRAKSLAKSALVSGNSSRLLGILFDRLYTLCNQLIHGGATWDGKVNRAQLRDCSRLLGKIVPVVIALMMDNPTELWGEAVYPVVDRDG